MWYKVFKKGIIILKDYEVNNIYEPANNEWEET